MKCAKCPFGTRSITDDGNITCCSGLQSRNLVDMGSVQLVRRSSPVQFALLGQAPRGGEPPKAAGGRSHTILELRNTPQMGIARGSRAAAWIGNVQQLEKVIFPEYGEVVGLVPSGFIAKRDENVAALLHALDLALEDAELRRVDFIIGGVDGE